MKLIEANGGGGMNEAAPDAHIPLGAQPVANERGERLPRIAVIGPPNSGKSLLFNRLTGKFTQSANYPYTTVDLSEHEVSTESGALVLVDTPGITGLTLTSEDEAPTRDLLLLAPPDAVMLCMDASHMDRSLALAAQLADLEIPTVVCLNMMDEALNKGIVVDIEALSKALELPVYPVCAADGRGVRRLADGVGSPRVPRKVGYPEWVQREMDAVDIDGNAASTAGRHWQLTHPDIGRHRHLSQVISEARKHWADDLAEKVVKRTGLEPKNNWLDRIFDLALHPVGAWFLLLATLSLVYLLVERVGVVLLAGFLEDHLVSPAVASITALTGGGVLNDILVGPFGLLTLGLFNAVCTVLPILAVFYLAYHVLEDIGYFPLLSAQFDRLLRRVGLTGRAVLPITLGFGCNTMATMATRALPGARQRFIACFLIALGVPCAVQLGVMVAILSTAPPLAIAGLVMIVWLLYIVVGNLLARLLPEVDVREFCIELPPLRSPRWRTIVLKTYHRLVTFFAEACPMFVASAGLLLVLRYTGILEKIRTALAPLVVHGLGLPIESADMLLLTLARREVGAVMMKDMVDGGTMDMRQVFVGLLVMTLFVPCMSNTLIMCKVVGGTKTALIFVAVTVIALGMGLATNAVWGHFTP